MKINKSELHTIFEGIINNQKEEFELLYKKYNKLVYRIAFSILKNSESSEDIAQKVFMKIWKLDKQKLPTRAEASWLYSLTKNEALNYLRTQKEEINIEELYYIAKEDTELNEMIDTDYYNRVISRLNIDEQEIVSLKVISGLSFKEISKILNIPIGTIQWKYYKSMNTLKLVIVNLSMFIISIGLFRAERKIQKSKKSAETELIGEANKNKISLGSNSIKENINNNQLVDSKGSETQRENRIENVGDTSTKAEINIIENDIFDNANIISSINETDNNVKTSNILEIENTVLESVTTHSSKGFNKFEIGMIGLSIIFLITTIVFFTIFIKGKKRENMNNNRKK